MRRITILIRVDSLEIYIKKDIDEVMKIIKSHKKIECIMSDGEYGEHINVYASKVVLYNILCALINNNFIIYIDTAYNIL